jgi:hypothetical protein
MLCNAQLYGPMRAAPALAGGAAAAAGDAAAADVHWSGQAVTSQQLAACLATPFTGQDQNLGEMVRARVDRLAANQQLSTQLRHAAAARCPIPPPVPLLLPSPPACALAAHASKALSDLGPCCACAVPASQSSALVSSLVA